ncbi:hypothetical protein Tco_1013931 [Tanacetum coccineum]
MKGLWDEFDALEAPYVCTCVCSCENGKENDERDHRKRLIQFLMGLDDSYANVRGQILLMQPLPSVGKAYNMIRQEEKQREGLIAKPPTSAIFSTISNNQRTVNMATIQEDPSTQAKQSQTAQPNTPSDAHFSARIDMLQNQLNQVLIMM